MRVAADKSLAISFIIDHEFIFICVFLLSRHSSIIMAATSTVVFFHKINFLSVRLVIMNRFIIHVILLIFSFFALFDYG
jgi:hypothetical protein